MSRSGRAGHESEAASSVWGWTVAAVVVIALGQLLLARTGLVSSYVRGILILAGINVTLAASLNIINGMTGQFSIGHAGFMAVGAYVGAAVTVFGGTALERAAAGGALDPARPVLNLFLMRVDGAPPGAAAYALSSAWFVVALVAAGLTAALAGVVVGIPTLRLRGDYLAIATLGFGEIVRVGLLNLEAMGGASGFNGLPPFGRIPPCASFAVVYLVALACVLVATTLKRSTLGRALLAIREDEVAAEAVGIDTTRAKVFAFALSAFFAGVAGALLAHDQGNINPGMFNFMRSIEVIAMVVLGGSGSTTGCVLAAIFLTFIREGLRDLAEFRMILYAEILLVMMLVRRQGLLGNRELCAAEWHELGHFLRTRGLRGVGAALLGWLRGVRTALALRLVRPGQAPWTAIFAGAVLLLPLVDLLLAWLLPPATQPYPRTYAAEIVAALTELLHRGMLPNAYLHPVASNLQIPLVPHLGLSIALLLLILPWSLLAFAIAEGRRRLGWVVVAAALLGLWHGGGLLLLGARLPRVTVEAFGAVLTLLAALDWTLGWRRKR